MLGGQGTQPGLGGGHRPAQLLGLGAGGLQLDLRS
jgi:hypothetical protein